MQVIKVPAVRLEDVNVPPSILNAAFMEEIKTFLKPDQVRDPTMASLAPSR